MHRNNFKVQRDPQLCFMAAIADTASPCYPVQPSLWTTVIHSEAREQTQEFGRPPTVLHLLIAIMPVASIGNVGCRMQKTQKREERHPPPNKKKFHFCLKIWGCKKYLH